VPKPVIPTLPYFPLKVGTEWVYEVTGEQKETLTETIMSVEEKDGMRTVKLSVVYEEVVNGVKMTEKSIRMVKVGEHGLFAVAPWPEVPGIAVCLLKLPPKPDSKWKEQFPEKALIRTCTMFEAERIKVPAGEYQAIRVETVYANDGKKEYRFSDDWYAPGVGLVKQQRRDINRVQVLKSFTLGKE
jgi:hypothetical protein